MSCPSTQIHSHSLSREGVQKLKLSVQNWAKCVQNPTLEKSKKLFVEAVVETMKKKDWNWSDKDR